ncbi:MAG: hypothetical protein AAGD05_10905 [Bacteroidota bacterium]
MNFKELSAKWQQEKMPPSLSRIMLTRFIEQEDQLRKENLKLSYWLAGSIYLTGFIAMPFITSEKLILILSGIWLLLTVQAMVFWFRQMHIDKAMIDHPIQFIEAKLSKLKFNLLVTNVFIPIYVLLLGLLSSCYLYIVLESLDPKIVLFIIGLTWLFYGIVFFFSWTKQRKKDAAQIIPQIKALKKIKANYQNGEEAH